MYTKIETPKIPIDPIKDRVFLDIESNKNLTPVEVTVIDYNGEILFDQLIKPHDDYFRLINQKEHVNISDESLINSNYTWKKVIPTLQAIFRSRIVVAYKIEHEQKFFPNNLIILRPT